ncbi:hypothetical protein CCMSSC00406_0002803 [Pleurotus cornucopiae]|uniref:Uncharacterized protein n=1 Tax=Pleurotus cornucopiae TaxID=5321 RepID=A0ACB7IXW9_PLECO|nr:hypothetical protein CCMSSC00406_0002803 [Pleurotus cornucopiae]
MKFKLSSADMASAAVADRLSFSQLCISQARHSPHRTRQPPSRRQPPTMAPDAIPNADQEPLSLDRLIAQTKSSPSTDLLPAELAYLITAFLPTEDFDVRSKAYLLLSSFCQSARASASGNAGKDKLLRVFSPPILSKLGDPGEKEFLAGVCFMTAFFQVEWETAATVFTSDGLVESILDQAETSPPSSLPHVARMFAQAAGHKPCRTSFTSLTVEWLEISARQTTIIALRAAAGLALVKLSRNTGPDGLDAQSFAQVSDKDAECFKFMKEIVISSKDTSSVADAVEGLAYLSVNPDFKEEIIANPNLLSRLFALVPRKESLKNDTLPDQATTVYGILVIISQLCAYRPQMSEEQTQIEKLKKMARAEKKAESKEPSPYDQSEYVTKRIRRLVGAGVLEVLVAASVARLDSVGVRVTVGKALLNIIETKEHRGKVLQAGGAKALFQMIKRGLNDQPLDAMYLDSIRALAKLAITASPIQVFGPNESLMYDAIRPFSTLLTHSSSNLLQRFEALMALTNLASQSPELCKRIANVEGLVGKVELMMLDDNTLVRRAAVELLCNLIVGSDEIFERYGGASSSPSARSRLEILVALSDVEDERTRVAASGALATLTLSEHVGNMLAELQLEKHKAFGILGQLIDPTEDTGSVEDNPGLMHRGVVCVRNIIVGATDLERREALITEAHVSGLTRSLEKVAAKAPQEVLRPLLETLTILRKQ